MEKALDYQELYLLQDEILNLMSSIENDFYLTGGTALHRFYFGARYSDDLDFFVSNGKNFNEDVEEFYDALIEQNYKTSRIVDSRDYYRFVVDEKLQIDLVNDRVFRYKKSQFVNGIRIDNDINILTNKICAILNRDEEKDIFDLFCFVYFKDFHWGDIFENANKKQTIQKDIFIYRLKTFPLFWLNKIKSIKEVEIKEEMIERICDDIEKEEWNRKS